MKKLKMTAVVAGLLIILVMAVLDTFGIVSYEQMMIFLKLREAPFTRADVSVHFIDVGQGDSTLIMSGDYVVLIDAGEKENGEKVTSYLRAHNISRIDHIIATHPHSDHIGGLEDVINNFETGDLIVPQISEKEAEESFAYKCLLDTAYESGISVCEAVPGMKLELGDSELDILACGGDYENINNDSIVSELVHDDNKFLFTADAEAESESDMLRRGVLEDIDVLKAGHHGSSTSSGGEFMEIVKPEFAVISCGAGNSYNHPSESVMRRFGDEKVNVFRTDLQGSIIAESDGKTLNFVIAGRE